MRGRFARRRGGGREVEQADENLGWLRAADGVAAADHEHRHAAHAELLGALVSRDHVAGPLPPVEELRDLSGIEAGSGGSLDQPVALAYVLAALEQRLEQL